MQTVKRILNGKGEVEFVPCSAFESSLAAMALENVRVNGVGDVSTVSAGYQYTIDTLTYIQTRVTTQKFYEVQPSDFFPVKVGDGGWADNIVTNIEFSAGGDFESGIIDSGNSEARLASVEAGISPKSLAVTMWGKKIGYNIAEVQQALYTNRWDAIEAKTRALKKNYDLGVQSIAFIGSKVDNEKTPGFLSNTDVNTNLALITKAISSMTAAEFQTFIKSVIAAYFTNSNDTVLPDTFQMPMTDYLGLVNATSDVYPVGSKLEYMLKAFKEATQNPNFEIKGLAYGDASRNAVVGINKQVYTLYRRMDETTLRMDVPLRFTLGAPNTADNFTFNAVGISRYTGVGIYRPLEVLRFQY